MLAVANSIGLNAAQAVKDILVRKHIHGLNHGVAGNCLIDGIATVDNDFTIADRLNCRVLPNPRALCSDRRDLKGFNPVGVTFAQ